MRDRLALVGLDLLIILLTLIVMGILLICWPFYLIAAFVLEWEEFQGIQDKFHELVNMRRK